MRKKYSRLTITLDNKILNEVDKTVDGLDILSRSAAIESLLKESLGVGKVKTAFINAGGVGTRMRPFTYEIPKSLIPVKGKPLIEHILDLLRKYEIKKVIIGLGYKAAMIKEHLGDGAQFGLKISYVIEKKKLGTAGPLKLAEKELRGGPFLLLWSDVLANIDLNDFMKEHHEHGGLCTIALTSVADPSRFGVARLKGNQILEFIEKPSPGEEPSNLINSGIAIFEPEILKMISRYKYCMVEKDIYPKLASAGKLFGYPFEGQWFDTGTHEAYEQVIKKWKGV